MVRGDSDINTTYLIWIWKKNYTWACDHLKTSNLSADNVKKYTRPRWVDNWARDTIRWYLPAVTLSWRLSIDHDIDVQSVFSWAPKLARKCESKHWFPCGTDGRPFVRSVYGHLITKFSGMGRFTHPWCSAGARFTRSRAPLKFKRLAKNML